jgi:hypothetical protein
MFRCFYPVDFSMEVTMSAFLGPIHYWLYHKIQLQQAIVDEIYILGEKNGLSLEEECDNRFGTFENKPLEEMIDHGNIHGWLQDRVSQVEYKYAYSVTKLLNKNPESMDTLKTVLKNNGIKVAITMKDNELKATDVFKAISDHLLDGMPCDHANRVLNQSDSEVLWVRSVCVHSSYWEEVDGDISVYYDLRDAWLEGLVRELGFVLEKPDTNTYCIKASHQ